ncbi:YlxR family protein [bacterium]|nr:YlxR family protein [bacterium]
MQRKCVVCGKYDDRENMIRITKTADGQVFVNGNSKIFGRSAYICYNKTCVEEALKKNRLQKVLKTQISEDLKGKIINEL